MERSISLILTSHNRDEQTYNTITSILKTSYKNFNIIILFDNSEDYTNDDRLYNLIDKKDNIYKVIIDRNKEYINPVVTLNTGIEYSLRYCKPEILVIQNAEAYHYGDILNYLNENLNDDNYINFGCFGLSQEIYEQYKNDLSCSELKKLIIKYNNSAIDDNKIVYYNHDSYNNSNFDYCGAITVNNIIKLNGYDERYYNKIWFGDNDYLLRIRRLGLNIITTNYNNSPVVLHQYHNKYYISDIERTLENYGYYVFYNIINNELNNYKAKHIFTDDFNSVLKENVTIVVDYDKDDEYNLIISLFSICISNIKNYTIIIYNKNNNKINLDDIKKYSNHKNINFLVLNNKNLINDFLIQNKTTRVIIQNYKIIYLGDIVKYSLYSEKTNFNFNCYYTNNKNIFLTYDEVFNHIDNHKLNKKIITDYIVCTSSLIYYKNNSEMIDINDICNEYDCVLLNVDDYINDKTIDVNFLYPELTPLGPITYVLK